MKEIAKIVLTIMSIILIIGIGVANVVDGVVMWFHLISGDEIV